jgi:hypothetical protein
MSGVSQKHPLAAGIVCQPERKRLWRVDLLNPCQEEISMSMQSGSAAMTGKPLIESDRVEGTTVYDPQGKNIGSIKRLMIEKSAGV